MNECPSPLITTVRQKVAKIGWITFCDCSNKIEKYFIIKNNWIFDVEKLIFSSAWSNVSMMVYTSEQLAVMFFHHKLPAEI